jgi:SAM-dependent methyltransferase
MNDYIKPDRQPVETGFEYLNVLQYFKNKYPDRSRTINVFFRKGEKQRIRLIKKWMSETSFSTVLDVGCGDGYFLSEVLEKEVELARIEDVNPFNIARARQKLIDKSVCVEAAVVDSFLSKENKRYDMVLAIGLSDYYRDWRLIIGKLINRTNESLIVDFPRAYTFHALIRRLWLYINKLELFTVTASSLKNLIVQFGFKYEIIKVSSNWMVLIKKHEKIKPMIEKSDSGGN